MDFGTLLHTAQKNEKFSKKEPVRYYSTKFEPPKKEQRNKQLSENIKKFLAKKEAEENEKKLEAQKRKDELMALRAKDKKATRRVNVMLKRTKSANQSVIQDAVDNNNTAVTLAGPIQPDEDDYGYVSQEAAAFYNKMVEKYNKQPSDPKFNFDKKKKTNGSLSSTKDRVKAALDRESEDAMHPRRKRKTNDEYRSDEPYQAQEEESPKKKKVAPPPPALNFNDLLKLAEKKQFEPIVIEQKPKEEEKLLTKKQKKEMEREKEWRDRREGKIPPQSATISTTTNRIPKLSDKTKDVVKNGKVNGISNENVKKNGIDSNVVKKPSGYPLDKKMLKPNENNPKLKPVEKKVTNNVPSSKLQQQLMKPITQNRTNIQNVNKVDANTKPIRKELMGKPKEFLPRDLQSAKRPPDNMSTMKPRQFPPKDLINAKQFPPADVRRKNPGQMFKKNKRRILDDDDEDYDSEMDDFIDDGPQEGEDYSKYISEIFGYDKNKYRYIDDDIDNMESTFAQQMREEAISKKIGIMEDLEDMRMEEEEKKMKAMKKMRK